MYEMQLISDTVCFIWKYEAAKNIYLFHLVFNVVLAVHRR